MKEESSYIVINNAEEAEEFSFKNWIQNDFQKCNFLPKNFLT